MNVFCNYMSGILYYYYTVSIVGLQIKFMSQLLLHSSYDHLLYHLLTIILIIKLVCLAYKMSGNGVEGDQKSAMQQS